MTDSPDLTPRPEAEAEAQYLRDLADRLLDYPTDHYKEAVRALAECADDMFRLRSQLQEATTERDRLQRKSAVDDIAFASANSLAVAAEVQADALRLALMAAEAREADAVIQRDAAARERDAVLTAPMAAGLLLTLKAECEAQHARAEAEKARADAAEAELATLRERIGIMYLMLEEARAKADAAEQALADALAGQPAYRQRRILARAGITKLPTAAERHEARMAARPQRERIVIDPRPFADPEPEEARIAELEVQLAAAQEGQARLRAAVEFYGGHRDECVHTPGACICGFDAAVTDGITVPDWQDGYCRMCGADPALKSSPPVAAPPAKCANGHEWTNDFGDGWYPEEGTPCDCGARRAGGRHTPSVASPAYSPDAGQMVAAPVAVVRQRACDFSEGYHAGYEDGLNGEADDADTAWCRSKASAELASPAPVPDVWGDTRRVACVEIHGPHPLGSCCFVDPKLRYLGVQAVEDLQRASVASPSGWQPIESDDTPWQGQHVIVWVPENLCSYIVARHGKTGRWMICGSGMELLHNPSHWHWPLPPPTREGSS